MDFDFYYTLVFFVDAILVYFDSIKVQCLNSSCNNILCTAHDASRIQRRNVQDSYIKFIKHRRKGYSITVIVSLLRLKIKNMIAREEPL